MGRPELFQPCTEERESVSVECECFGTLIAEQLLIRNLSPLRAVGDVRAFIFKVVASSAVR